jgi:DNA-binding beta-propeller fold protein YncE
MLDYRFFIRATIAVFLSVICVAVADSAFSIEPQECILTPPGEGLAWDGDKLWLSSVGNNMIYQIDSDNGEILNSVPSPGSSLRGGDLAFDGAYLWLVDPDPVFGGVFQINSNTGLVIRTIPLYSLPFSAAGHSGLTWGEDALWLSAVSEALIPTIYKVDPDNVSLLGSFSVSVGQYGFTGLAWTGTYLWLSSSFVGDNNSGFYKIDPHNGEVAAVLRYDHAGQGLASNGDYLWNTDSSQGRICKFDPAIEICGGANEILDYGIYAGDNVVCTADYSINMIPGFFVEENATFRARISE